MRMEYLVWEDIPLSDFSDTLVNKNYSNLCELKNDLIQNNTQEDIHFFFVFNSLLISEGGIKRVETCISLCEIFIQEKNNYFEETLSQLLLNKYSIHFASIQ